MIKLKGNSCLRVYGLSQFFNSTTASIMSKTARYTFKVCPTSPVLQATLFLREYLVLIYNILHFNKNISLIPFVLWDICPGWIKLGNQHKIRKMSQMKQISRSFILEVCT